MRLGGRPVFLVCANAGPGKFRAATITSLVSTDVEQGQEEVGFVLSLSSRLLDYLAVGSTLSVCLLGEAQSKEATYFASPNRPDEVLADRTDWRLESGVPVFLQAIARLTGKVSTIVPRSSNCLVLASVASVTLSPSQRALLYEDGKFCRAEGGSR